MKSALVAVAAVFALIGAPACSKSSGPTGSGSGSGSALVIPPYTPAADVQKNLKAMLSQSLTKMDLVTREEFDIQTQVLTRTREKLAALEARLKALEGPGAH